MGGSIPRGVLARDRRQRRGASQEDAGGCAHKLGQLVAAVDTGAGVGVAGVEGTGAESSGGVDAGAGVESAGGVEAGAEVGSLAGVAFESAGGVAVASGAEASGAGPGDEPGPAAGTPDEVESEAGVGSESAILSFGMTCAIPSSALSSRGVSSGYLVFHSATNFARGLVSIMEKSRIIDASSMARISSID